jgi:glycosyltransferase involved in cell wall biosynthesis
MFFSVDGWKRPMIEALACGTPVIARRRGSVPEILRDGETGFICREEFEARFTDRSTVRALARGASS